MATKSSKTPGVPHVEAQISYCPELGIYHYVKSDGSEYFFDNVKLEESLALYLSQQKTNDIHYMNGLTRAARSHPHQILIYDTIDQPPRIVDPVPLYSFDRPGDVPVGKSGKWG